MDQILKIQKREKEFYDLVRAKDLRTSISKIDLKTLLAKENIFKPFYQKIGDVKNKTILDYGCGTGIHSVILAKLGADVEAFDISAQAIRSAKFKARANKVKIKFKCNAAPRLPYSDNKFDLIVGNAILHHVHSYREVGKELYRVLKKNGRAIFNEPFGENIFFEFIRKYIYYPNKCRTKDEKPLRYDNIKEIGSFFHQINIQEHQLFQALERVYKNKKLLNFLERTDKKLLRNFPALKKYCRYVIIELIKD